MSITREGAEVVLRIPVSILVKEQPAGHPGLRPITSYDEFTRIMATPKVAQRRLLEASLELGDESRLRYREITHLTSAQLSASFDTLRRRCMRYGVYPVIYERWQVNKRGTYTQFLGIREGHGDWVRRWLEGARR